MNKLDVLLKVFDEETGVVITILEDKDKYFIIETDSQNLFCEVYSTEVYREIENYINQNDLLFNHVIENNLDKIKLNYEYIEKFKKLLGTSDDV